eukprot:3693221-Karenia_brevis.AAC.1
MEVTFVVEYLPLVMLQLFRLTGQHPLHKQLSQLETTTDLPTTQRIEAAWFCAASDNATYINGLRSLTS